MTTVITITCSKCKLPKDSSEFDRGGNKNGFRSQCKLCRYESEYKPRAEDMKSQQRERYATDPEWREQLLAYEREKYAADPSRKRRNVKKRDEYQKANGTYRDENRKRQIRHRYNVTAEWEADTLAKRTTPVPYASGQNLRMLTTSSVSITTMPAAPAINPVASVSVG